VIFGEKERRNQSRGFRRISRIIIDRVFVTMAVIDILQIKGLFFPVSIDYYVRYCVKILYQPLLSNPLVLLHFMVLYIFFGLLQKEEMFK